MTPCPCCGQPVDTDGVLLSLEANTASRWGRMVKLRPMCSEMLFKLLKDHPKTTVADALSEAVYGNGTWPTTTQSLRVHAVYLRKALRSLGVDLVNVRGVGYRLMFDE